MKGSIHDNGPILIEDLEIDVLPGGVAGATAGPVCVVLIIALIMNMPDI